MGKDFSWKHHFIAGKARQASGGRMDERSCGVQLFAGMSDASSLLQSPGGGAGGDEVWVMCSSQALPLSGRKAIKK